MNTELGKKLQKIKDDYIAKGGELLDEAGFEKELRERKGIGMTYREWIESYFALDDTWDDVVYCNLGDKILNVEFAFIRPAYLVYTKKRIYLNYEDAHISVDRDPKGSSAVYIRKIGK